MSITNRFLIDWNKVFDPNEPNSMWNRPVDLSTNRRTFSFYEKRAANDWNYCAVGNTLPGLRKVLEKLEPKLSKMEKAIEYFGVAFNYAVSEDNREIASMLWEGIKLLAEVKTKKKLNK